LYIVATLWYRGDRMTATRPEFFKMRVNKKELRAWTKAAQALGMTTSAWVRSLVYRELRK
jgi:hypothetical protein